MNSSIKPFHIPLPRRKFLQALAAASAGFTVPGALAEALTLSPEVTQGPYYPEARNIPLDDDNDLVRVQDHLTSSAAIITHLRGRVLTANGTPIKDALVELWHADAGGNYIHDEDAVRNPDADPNFHGFGQFLTGSGGEYRFRTVKAGLYEGRTRHFHLAVTIPGQSERLTTQTFWNETALDANGRPWDMQNANDMVLQGIEDPAQRASVILNYAPVPGTPTGEVAASYDFVVGLTPLEPLYPGGGHLPVTGAAVPGPDGRARYQIAIPVYRGYTYEVYSNATPDDTDWRARSFALTRLGQIDRNRQTATADGKLVLYVDQRSADDRYKVFFRLPGANPGMP